MKRILILLLIAITAISLFAQKDVTTFLGIPVDGTKATMKQKLIAKGFTPKRTSGEEYLVGEFNGSKVKVYIVTNRNKVYRIMVDFDLLCSETEIKNRFNNLVIQFDKNKKYMKLSEDSYLLPDNEDISYGITINNKTYEAAYIQKPNPEKMDSVALEKQLNKLYLEKFSQFQLDNPTDDVILECKKIAAEYLLDFITKKSVWFRINDSFGLYSINLYYDNEYNRVNGDDL